jgi:hypothetical protein
MRYLHPISTTKSHPKFGRHGSKISAMSFLKANRVIRKVRKTQHQYPEFGHTQGEIKKNL